MNEIVSLLGFTVNLRFILYLMSRTFKLDFVDICVVAFRCAYCFYWNPARKQRPSAPRLEDLAPQLPPPLPPTQDQDEEEEEEDQESSSGEEEEEEEGGAEGEVLTQWNHKASAFEL